MTICYNYYNYQEKGYFQGVQPLDLMFPWESLYSIYVLLLESWGKKTTIVLRI